MMQIFADVIMWNESTKTNYTILDDLNGYSICDFFLESCLICFEGIITDELEGLCGFFQGSC